MDPGATFYLDHNAATPVDPRVLACFVEVERSCPANPASLHAPGRRAWSVVASARTRIARVLGVDDEAIVFVSGGTEANNLAVLGLGDPSLPVLLAAVEHPSVVEPARLRGIEWWGVDAAATALVRAPVRRPGLVCLVHAQSEVGTLQPVAAAADLATQLAVPLHVDAAQTLGRHPIAEVVLRADSIALSPHKCGGLRGMGVLVLRSSRWRGGLRPLLRGGGQELGRRPGTVSPALAAATALAIELAVAETAERAERMRAARQNFVARLHELLADLRVLTPMGTSVPNTAMVHFRGVEGRNLLPALDLDGVAASTGSACSSGAPQPPPVLLAMGLADDDARACVRFSFGRDADLASAARAAERAAAVIARLRKKS